MALGGPLAALMQGSQAGEQLAGLSAFGDAGVSAGLAGGAALAGIGGATAVTAGLAAIPAAVIGAVDLFKCGTLGTIGCDKRSDTDIDEQLAASARLILWMVESKQATAAQGKAALAQLLVKAKSAYRDLQRSYLGAFTVPNYSCGSWLDSTSGNAVNPGLSIPATSVAATLDCGSSIIGKSLQQVYEQDFPAAMDKLAGATANPTGPAVPVGSPIGPSAPVRLTSAPAPTSGHLGLILGAGAAVLLLVAVAVH